MGFVQLYFDKTALTFKENALIAYPVHGFLLNFPPSWRRWLINNGNPMLGFLRGSNVESLERFVVDDATSIRRFTSGYTFEV